MDGLKYFTFSCLSFYMFGLLFARKLSHDEMLMVVNEHNKIRNLVALGLMDEHPSGGDILFMEWDPDMAHTAEMEIRDLVKGGEHDPELLGDDNIGHSEAKNLGIAESIASWYSGRYSHLYDKGCIPGDVKCMAFAQMVQNDVSKVGCAIAKHSGSPNIFLCHYKPQLKNHGVRPYQRGSPKINCPDDFGFQRINMPGLCASKENCDEEKASSCMCRISRCENEGVFNSDQCSCDCPTSYGGLGCQSCEMSGCDNGGIFNQTSCSCLCADGYTGTKCEMVVMDVKEEDLVLSSGMGSGDDGLSSETVEEFDSTCFKNSKDSIFKELFQGGSADSLEFFSSPSSSPSKWNTGQELSVDAIVDGGMVSNKVGKSHCSEEPNFAFLNWKQGAQSQTSTARTINPVTIVTGRPTCVRFYYLIFGDDPGELLVRFEMYRNVEDLTVVEDDVLYQLTGRSLNKPTWVSQEIDLSNAMDFMFIEFIGKQGKSGVVAFDRLLVFEQACKDVPN